VRGYPRNAAAKRDARPKQSGTICSSILDSSPLSAPSSSPRILFSQRQKMLIFDCPLANRAGEPQFHRLPPCRHDLVLIAESNSKATSHLGKRESSAYDQYFGIAVLGDQI
jgi:hypothetical protein